MQMHDANAEVPAHKANTRAEVVTQSAATCPRPTSLPIRLLLIEDETLFAKSLADWLSRNPGFEVVGVAGSGKQGWEFCLANQPEIVLLDVQMDDMDGLTLAQRLRKELPAIRVIIMTGRVDAYVAWRALQADVHGLLDKVIQPKVLAEAIRLVAAGERFISPAFQEVQSEWLSTPDAFQKVLTNRELEVLMRVTDGQTDQSIAEKLGISAETVAGHRKSMRKKLGMHDDRHLMAYGRQWGIFGL